MTDGGIVGSEEVGVRGRADTVDVLTRAYVVDHLETEVYSAPSHSFLFTSMEPTLEIRPRDRAFDGLAEWPWGLCTVDYKTRRTPEPRMKESGTGHAFLAEILQCP